MFSDEEIEEAKNTMASGLEMVWVLHGSQPSAQLHEALDAYPDFSKEIWLDILKKVKDPLLVSYAVEYLGLSYHEENKITGPNKNGRYHIWLYVGGVILIIWLALG